MTGSPVLTATEGRTGWITLNRPEAMNAVTTELAVGLEDALTRLARDSAVIVIRGAGGNFSVGGDFKELERLRDQGTAAMARLFESFGRALARIAQLPVPVVAAVEGYALAGGFELMQAADIAVVAEEAKIADHHSNFGQIPGGGSSQRLPRLVGRQRALAHLLTGDRLTGAEAVAWGLAYRAVPAAGLDVAVRDLAERLAGKDPAALARTKRLVHEGLERPLAEGLAMERAEVLAHLAGNSAAEGIATFTNRRG